MFCLSFKIKYLVTKAKQKPLTLSLTYKLIFLGHNVAHFQLLLYLKLQSRLLPLCGYYFLAVQGNPTSLDTQKSLVSIEANPIDLKASPNRCPPDFSELKIIALYPITTENGSTILSSRAISKQFNFGICCIQCQFNLLSPNCIHDDKAVLFPMF